MAAKSPIRWHGGKSPLAAKIRQLFPKHKRYCEPYFGGGSVLFSGDGEGVAEFANDVNRELCNFWQVLQDDEMYRLFIQDIAATPFSQEGFNNACEFYGGGQVLRAVMFFVRNRQSRQGLGKDFATPTTRLRRGMNENVSAWLSAVEGLPEFHARLKRVEIRNQDALVFIRELDTPDTLFYLDPPYLHSTRSSTGEYEHEMTAQDHANLLVVLGGKSIGTMIDAFGFHGVEPRNWWKIAKPIRGKFALSGYNSPMYQLLEDEIATRHEFPVDNKASGKKKKETKIECVWTNF